MALQKYVLMMAVVASMQMCSAHIGGHQSTQDLTPRVYCGRILARMIASVCYDDLVDKRSEPGTMYGALLPPYYKEQETHIRWPWMVPSKARALESSRGKRFTGVADECCEKPCSITEIMSYC